MHASRAPSLTAHGLSCRYRGRPSPTLQGIDLELHPGQVTLLAGGSASGKTSLVRCLNGLVPRAFRGSTRAGDLRLAGEPIGDWTLARIGGRVGTLLQDPARQIVGQDTWRELAFGPENLGLAQAEIEARVQTAAERLGIAELFERRPEELSGGQLQKVALGGVLTMEPEVLLLDEPLAALDPVSARKTAGLIRELADEGRAVLVVEHRIEELAHARADRAVILEAGRVAYDGDLAGFLERADPAALRLPCEAAVRRWRDLGPGREAVSGARIAVDPATEPLLEFAGVSFAYAGGTDALRGASLSVSPGETVALLGANGAGKSTLLRHALGLLRGGGGCTRVGGRDVAECTTAELAREAGLVFQDPGAMLFAETVEEECLFAPRNLGLDEDRARERVDGALARLDLEELRHEAPGALSIGQRKRVCLAAVASQGARLWLLDEPTAGLDPGGVGDFLGALRGGAERGEAVVFATHDLDLALLLADRVALVDQGRVLAAGPAGEVLLDDGLLEHCRLLPTSLLERNRARLERGLDPLDARQLAREELEP